MPLSSFFSTPHDSAEQQRNRHGGGAVFLAGSMAGWRQG